MEIEIRDFDILLVSAAHTVARGNTEVLETFLESKRNKKQSPTLLSRRLFHNNVGVGHRWSFCLIGESAMLSGSPAVAVTTGCTIVGAAEESGGRESKCFRVVFLKKLRNVSDTLVSLVVVLCCAETSKISKSRISNFEKKSLFFLLDSCTELGECSLKRPGTLLRT